MQATVAQMSIDVFTPALTQLSAVLEKARAHAESRKFEANAYLASRLAPDMFALTRQVQLACDFAKNSTARLAGTEPPKIPDEESTLDELKARIDKTLAYLASVDPRSLEGSETRTIRVPLRDRTLEMPGLPFLQRWALPNFFFHVVTAYVILRHDGVPIGKSDFLGGV